MIFRLINGELTYYHPVMDFSSLISLIRVSFPQYTYFYQEYTYIHTLNNTYIYIAIQNAPFTKLPGRNFQDVTVSLLKSFVYGKGKNQKNSQTVSF